MLSSLLLVASVLGSQDPSLSWLANRGYPSFGSIVGDVGDLDSDGIADLVVGDPGHSIGTLDATLWVVSTKTGAVLRRVELPGDALPDPSWGGEFIRVHAGGWFDEDRTPDFLVSVQPRVPGERGVVILVSGATGGILRRFSANGSRSDAQWARVVGDIDLDDIDDVGTLEFDLARRAASLVVHSGASGAVLWKCPVLNDQDADAGSWFTHSVMNVVTSDFYVALEGRKQAPTTLSCYSAHKQWRTWKYSMAIPSCWGTYAQLASFADMDHDGKPDLAVGSCDSIDVVGSNTGTMLSRFRPDGKRNHQVGFGWALSPVGDLDHDGFQDLAISEPDSDGFVGAVQVKSGATGKSFWKVGGLGHPEFGEASHIGSQMSTLGDVDADGIDDLVVGSNCRGQPRPGFAFLVSGRDGSVLMRIERKGDDLTVTRPRSPKAKER